MTDDYSTVLYYPTPLEQAYSLYLAQQIFHVTPKMALHISGRSAVPFLTESGVNRGTLRSIWTAADPQNYGTLTQLTQFQLLLRLVSMAQAGILDAHGSADSMRESVQEYSGRMLALPVFQTVAIPPHENLLAMYGMFVIQYQQQQAPEQSHATSFGMSSPGSFGMSSDFNNVNSIGATRAVSVDDAFSDLGPTTNAPLPSLDGAGSNADPTPSNGSGEDVPSLNAGNSVVGYSSGTHAPGSVDTMAAIPAAAPVTDTDEDEFGDFEDVATTSAPSPSEVESFLKLGTQETTTGQPAPAPSDDPFGAFGEATNQPLPSLGTPSSMQNTESNNDFGDFSGAPAASNQYGSMAPASLGASALDGSAQSSMMGPTPITSAPIPEQDDFGAFGAAPSQDASQDASQDDFGGFNGAMQRADTTSATRHTTASAPTGAAPTQNTSYEGDAQPIHMQASTISVPDTSQTASSPQDQFGRFEMRPSQDQFGSFGEPPQSMASPSFDGSIQSASNNMRSSVPVSIPDDAFGELGVQDAPLPPLEQFGTATTSNGTGYDDAAPSNIEEDDFGGFATATVPSHDGGSGMPDTTHSNDLLSGVPEVRDEPLPQWDVGTEQSESGFAVALSDPSASTPAHQVQGDDNEAFGGFEAASPAPLMTQKVESCEGQEFRSFDQVQTTTSPDDGSFPAGGQSMGGISSGAMDDPFGVFSVEDAPLTPLRQFSSNTEVAVPESEENQGEDGGFGGFEEAPSIANGDVVDKAQASTEDIFADMSSVSDQPAPIHSSQPEPNNDGEQVVKFPGHNASNTTMSEHAPDLPKALTFGGSVNKNETREDSGLSYGNGKAEDPFSAFDSISGPAQPELPPLSSTYSMDSRAGEPSEVPAVSEIDEDSFGDFASPLQPTTELIPTVPMYGGQDNGDDEFGNFESFSNFAPAQDSIDTVKTSNTMDDPFADFDAQQNQPELTNRFDTWASLPQDTARGASIRKSSTQPSEWTAAPKGDSDAFAPVPEQAIQSMVSPFSGEEIFGDFDGAPSQSKGAPAELSQNEFDTFRSHQAPPSLPSSTGTFGMSGANPNEATADVPLSASLDKHLPVDSADEDWGEFDGPPTARELTVEGSDLFRKEEELNRSDEFGNLNVAQSRAGSTQAPDEISGAFDDVPPVRSSNAASESDGLGSGNEKDDVFVPFQQAPSDDLPHTDMSDNWGDFGSAPMPGGNSDISSDGYFGAFESYITPSNPDPTIHSAGDFGALESSAPVYPGPSIQAEDDFGAFESIEPTKTESSIQTDGDFGAFEFSAPAKQDPSTQLGVLEPGASKSSSDNWGALDSFADGPKDEHSVNFDPVPAKSPSSEDDWGGDFEDVPVSTTSTATAGSLQDKVRGLSMPLTETLLRKTEVPGGFVDLGECYEVNIGLNSRYNTDTDTKQRVDRCIRILKVLSKMNHNDGSTYWEKVLKVINDDLTQGLQVLEEAQLSFAECEQIAEPLRLMLAGFREYIRVSRSIVATIGDILLVDSKALLTIDTMSSTWCSLAVLQLPLEIESTWKNILKVSKSLRFLSGVEDAPSLAEIRLANTQDLGSGRLCDLTLQPLSINQQGTPMNPIAWNGKDFMACSANLLANRCPFFVPGN